MLCIFSFDCKKEIKKNAIGIGIVYGIMLAAAIALGIYVKDHPLADPYEL